LADGGFSEQAPSRSFSTPLPLPQGGRYRPPNLVLVVFHNGVYASCGDGQVRTAAATTTDLAAVARARGIDSDRVVTLETIDATRKALGRALSEPGPWVLVASIEAPDVWPAGRAATGPRFRRDRRRVQARDDAPWLPLGRPGVLGRGSPGACSGGSSALASGKHAWVYLDGRSARELRERHEA